jgi:hypothetical protein
MNEEIFKERTKKLAVAMLKLAEEMPRSIPADAIGR